MSHMVACGFNGMCLTKSEISTRITLCIPVHITTLKSNSQHITLCLQCSIVVFKPHLLTVTMVTKCTYYN